MDFIELQSAWAVLQQDINRNDTVDEDKILSTVHSKSKSEISKIKRGLHLKFIIASLAILVALGLVMVSFLSPDMNPLNFIFSPKVSSIFYSIMALSVSIMVYFNYKAYVEIKAVQTTNIDLKENLKSFIDAMNKAIAFNIFSDAFMTPIVFTWVFYAYAFKDQTLGFDLKTFLLFTLPFAIALLSYFFQKFMQYLKFGKYVMKLNTYYDALENKSKEL